VDPLRFAIAVVPLAAYLIVVGLVNLSSRPIVTTGARDFIAMAVACVGLAFVGPLELFMPHPAAALFGWLVWVVLLALYSMSAILIVLFSRPRIVIYNITPDELRPILAETVVRLDKQARWAGDNLLLPEFGLQMHMDSFAGMRNVSLVATGEKQNLSSWSRLERELSGACARLKVPRNSRGIVLASLGTALFLASLWGAVTRPMEIAEALPQLLRL
jgi:hypothetical protein